MIPSGVYDVVAFEKNNENKVSYLNYQQSFLLWIKIIHNVLQYVNSEWFLLHSSLSLAFSLGKIWKMPDLNAC